MAVPSKIAKSLELDLSDVPRSQRSKVKQQVGEFVVGAILEQVSQGRSPVKGKGKFKRLSAQYAEEEKGGDRNPNLDLEGDMLNSLEFKNTRNGVEVGIFKSSEVPKADGHNNFSGMSKLPERRFIPDQDETFKSDIDRGIKRIIEENKVVDRNNNVSNNLSAAREFARDFVRSLTVDDLFDNDGL
jgi:hypothetical protein